MVNLFKAKKWAVLTLPGMISVFILVLLLFLNTDAITAIGISFFALLIFAFIGTILLAHPLISYLEGNGYNVWDLNSTGVIRNFVVAPKLPMIQGRHNGENIERIFDRETIWYLGNPETALSKKVPEGLLLFLPNSMMPSANFMANGHPTLIWNSNMNSFMTKELLSSFETNSFIRHIVLDLLKKQEDIRFNLRDFVRYVVNSLRPKIGFLESNPWIIWVVVVALIALLGYFMWPSLSTLFGGAVSNAGNVIPSNPITPK